MCHNEENHSKREHVNLCALVLPTFFNLGCHIRECTSVTLEAVDLFTACEAKVSKF